MARDEAYREAEQMIERAQRELATELSLRRMILTEVPESLGNLTRLQSLYLSYNQLTSLSESLGKLTQLQLLDLSVNGLTSLPESLGNLTQLQSLDLRENKLTSLPESLSKLTQLRALGLSSNQLTSVPESLGKLTQLQSLYLSNNKLTLLPESLGKLTQLRTLDFGNNRLTSLPESLGNLTQLRTLRLWGNQLTSLSESLGNLTQLRTLRLSNNQLTSLPEWLGNLTQLQLLSLWGNQLTSLSDWVGNFTQLRELNLNNNRLTDLPASLGQLSCLKILNLKNNPLNPDLVTAYTQGTEAVLQFLRERVVEEVVLYEAKLILVGEGAVGKSSLLGALRGDEWEEDRDTTHGVEIKLVQLTIPDSDVELTLNGWDFGGQPVYRPTHQLFFSAPAVYLVVWKPREGPEQGFVNYWTKLIKHRAYDKKRLDERPRVLVVATHGGPKERQAHIDEQALRDQFGDLIEGFYHVDSKPDPDTGQCPGLDELKEVLARTTVSIPQVGRKVPGSWKRMLDAVKARAEKDAYVTYQQFEELCQMQGVGPDLAATYANIMNELGHLIHYGDDEGLKDIVILKAEWLSKAISFVLEDSVVKEQNGLIHHNRLGELWNDPARPEAERYPSNLHPIFLRLMERFDLSYRVVTPDGGRADAPPDTSLIAQLVPGARPAELGDDWGTEPETGDVQRTQVCRVVDATTGVPAQAEGLLYQLIVRLHRYSLGRTDYSRSRHWQLGLLMDDDYNGRALLEQIGNDVRITVRAAYPERFLGMLSEEVKWLVEHFWRGLNCQIAVPCAPPCRGLLELEALIDTRRRGYPDFRCPVCGNWLSIDSLLAKPAEMPPLNVALAELRQGQVEIQQAVDMGFQSVRTDLRRLISQADEQFALLMTTLTDEARDGPRLFSLTPVEPGRWDKPKWISQKVRLTLWCEHSRVPVTELWIDPSRGVYEFEMPREWLVRMAPYARFVAGTLSLVLPVAGSAVKLALDETAYKQIEKNLDLSQKSFSALLGAGSAAGKWLAHDDEADLSDYADQAEEIRGSPLDERHYGRPRAAQGALLRELQALLRERDPGFGGLKRVQNKRREYLWIHPRFEKEYYPDPPVIPPPE